MSRVWCDLQVMSEFKAVVKLKLVPTRACTFVTTQQTWLNVFKGVVLFLHFPLSFV